MIVIDKLREYFPNLFGGNSLGSLSTGIEIVGVIAIIAFLYFLFFVKKSHKNPFWALVVGTFGVAIFLVFFYGGVKIGKLLGIGEIGAMGGIFLFFFLATVLKYFMTPKDERRKKFM